ncbi:Hypothetical_protein [Hexamita inflata]|uniref:Hypothetical_protein n=1 Tax=Hexamita inflata TaxID=28002 RepID=A0AA86QVA5_9EUKA|nr:Hypothetical protein HINF_LOCUS49811 [Hexamita inflata]
MRSNKNSDSSVDAHLPKQLSLKLVKQTSFVKPYATGAIKRSTTNGSLLNSGKTMNLMNVIQRTPDLPPILQKQNTSDKIIPTLRIDQFIKKLNEEDYQDEVEIETEPAIYYPDEFVNNQKAFEKELNIAMFEDVNLERIIYFDALKKMRLQIEETKLFLARAKEFDGLIEKYTGTIEKMDKQNQLQKDAILKIEFFKEFDARQRRQ